MDQTWQSPQLASQVSRLKPAGLLHMGMDERTGLQCEGGNMRCIAWLHFGCRRPHQKQSAEAAMSNLQFTTHRQPVLWPVVAFSKTSFKHR